MVTCDICGEPRKCKMYRCTFGQYTEFMCLCDDCVKIQEKEGPVVEDKSCEPGY